MSDDMTFCGNDCNNKKCFRHPSNIQEPRIPHSFAYLKGTADCPMNDKLCKHYKPVTDDKYDFFCEHYNCGICGDCSNCEYYEVAHKQEVRLIDANALKEELAKCEKEPDYQHEGEDWRNGLYIAETIIDNAPTVTPERLQGEWIDHSDEGYVECPFCGSATTCEDNIEELHYCYSCGAKLRGEKK